MLFVDSLKFKNKSNKLAVLPEPTFYEFPIIIGVRKIITVNTVINFFFNLTFTTRQYIACNLALAIL